MASLLIVLGLREASRSIVPAPDTNNSIKGLSLFILRRFHGVSVWASVSGGLTILCRNSFSACSNISKSASDIPSGIQHQDGFEGILSHLTGSGGGSGVNL